MMIYRTLSRLLMAVPLTCLLVACGASPQEPRAVEEAAALEAAHRQAEEQAAAARAQEAEQARAAADQERVAAEAAREAAAEAEREAARQAELAQIQEQQARAQLRAQAEAVAQAQRARVTQLERQIENTSDEVQELEQVNDSLEQAVTAAEELLRALNEEQLKYASTTADGALQEPLDKERIAELEARMDALRREIEAQSR